MDRSKRVCVEVLTGWNDITKGNVVLKSETDNLTLDLEAALGQVYAGNNGIDLEEVTHDRYGGN